ncbi:PREDICTED: uncharacterized protein LOC106818159 [Priapulus caudatus]|uniref:Uncharacterized protein LOC106818159 n=1 Tax=Priapulus caudatus TaxID=37621 RepID=A0ABM1F1P8_PRICU|nr:PREDICTED: uncharacterized protein LOC106818159 [Priapulus caudatus]
MENARGEDEASVLSSGSKYNMSRSFMDMATSTQWSLVTGARITEAALMPSLRSAQSIPFYSVYDHASDYAELACYSSLLYKLLKFFESDFERKSKMHKRRVDTPRGVFGELHPCTTTCSSAGS